jgi:ABC-type sugar transport system permease subunit
MFVQRRLDAHAARANPRWSLHRQDSLLGILLILPALVLVASFVLGPLATTLGLGFFSRHLTRPNQPTTFVGLQNYEYLFQQNLIQPVLLNSILISTGTVVVQLVIGMVIALLLNRQFVGRGVVRASFIMAWAIPTIAAAFVMRWMFDVNYGAINKLLLATHLLSTGIPWLASPQTAPFTVVLANAWKGLPYPVLIFLAGLQLIPSEIREAARVDGVRPWQEFLYITLPHLRFVIAIFVVLRFIWTFNWFDLVYLLTGGGPAGATMVLPVRIYIAAFRTFNIGLSSAMGTIMALTLIAFTVLFLRVMADREPADV